MTADIAIPSHNSTCFPHFERRDPKTDRINLYGQE